MKDPAKAKKYHYTYLILNITNDMKYIGARSCDCLPKLDTKYMSSSKYVEKAIKEGNYILDSLGITRQKH